MGRTRLRNIFRLGIRQKVALILLTTLFVALSTSGWMALQSQRADILRETHLRGSELARFAAQSLANNVVGYDYHAIEQWLQHAVREHEDIEYLRVISGKGNTMAETGVPPERAEDIAVFDQDIRVDSEKVGALVLGLSTKRITASFQKQQEALIKSEFLVILFIVVVEFAALSLIIVRPITLFSTAMSGAQIVQERRDEAASPAVAGDPPGAADSGQDEATLFAGIDTATSGLPLATRDEIGDLARSFVHLQKRTNLAVEGLRRSEKKNRALIDAIPDMMFRFNRDGVCLDCKIPRNIAVESDLQCMTGKHLFEALPADTARTFMNHLNTAFASRQGCEFHYLQEVNGGRRSFEARVSVSADDEALVIVRDTTEHKDMQERIRFLAHFDSLTHLPNRILFKERVQSALGHARPGNRCDAVMVLDLDRFKVINDTLGHAAGDLLLQSVAERLQRCLRAIDYIAHSAPDRAGAMISRPGGDEFAILLTQLPDIGDAASVARRMLDTLSTPFRIEGHDIGVSASVGIAVHPNDAQDAETLIRNADAAMHHAKDEGRNNYQYYTPRMNTALSRRLTLENSLRKALEREELRVYYQPQVEVVSGRIVGAEALLRWAPASLGQVSPAEFIPLAEDTGLIIPIGEWVLRTACAQNRAWQDMGLLPLRVAVNISGVQFRQPSLAAQVHAILVETGLPPHALELEVTEGIILRNDEQVIQTLSELKALGVHLSLDDFGTGYSSLSYLKRFPLDSLKIDRSFVRDINENADNSELAGAILAMAHSLKLKVVAEGVETHAQLAFLRSKGCDLAQGFLFSPARLPEELLEALGGSPLAPGAYAAA